MRHTRTFFFAGAFATAALFQLSGCGGSGNDTSGAQPSEAKLSEKALAVLAKADAADEKTDHVVTQCLTCSLHMAGSEEQEVEVAGYRLHLCSGACKEKFEKDPEAALLALELPEGGK